MRRKSIYLLSVAALAVTALALLLAQDFGGTASAQRNGPEDSGTVVKKTARADMLSFALDLRSASDYAVFAEKGIINNNSRIKGETSDSLRAGDETGERVRDDLRRSFSAIGQLPCQELGGQLTGGRFEPGVYCATGGNLARLSLDGRNNPNAIFIFRVAGGLKAGAGFEMELLNDARAANVYFVADEVSIEGGAQVQANVLATKDIQISSGAGVTGKTISLDGAVTATEASLAPAAPGVLQICKQEAIRDQQVPALGAVGPLANRVFRFRIGANIYEVPVGQCSGPITLEEGNYTIEELLDGRTLPSGTFNGRFRLVDVNSPTPGALGAVNLPARTANVFIRPGDISNQTIVNFVNTFAITAVIEICKRPVFPSNPNTVPRSTAPINDQDVTGFFDFTVDAIANTIFTVPVGQCSGPIQVNVPTSPGPVPQPAIVRVTELAEAGFTLESASTFPADRFINLVLNAGIRNTTACSTIDGGPVPPACLLSPNNNGGGYVTGEVLEGGTSSQTTFNFFNRSNPGRVKVCKIAGPGIPEGTRFRFEVRGLAPSNPFPGPYLPGVNVIRFVDVVAGPASQGGFCNFVEGTFIVGSSVLVRETQVLDPIPGPAFAPAAERLPAEISSSGVKPSKTVIGETQKSQDPAQTVNQERIPYQEFRINGEVYKEAAPPVALSRNNGGNSPSVNLASNLKSNDVIGTMLEGAELKAAISSSNESAFGGNAQPAILGATSASNRAVVYPDANDLPTPVQNLVTGLPAGAQPHGVAYFGTDNALISDFSNSRIHVVQISTAALLSTINTATAGYDGTGTVAVAPNLSAALAIGSSNSLKVIQGPFGPASTITSVTLPGGVAAYQTQAIVFNNAGRAFVYHTTGISVLDAPYNAIAFTIPLSNGASGAIGISPNGNTLLTTALSGNQVRIIQAPFSAASTSTALTIPGGNALDGIMVAPDGTRAIVVSSGSYHAAAIFAPFSSASTVESIPLPATGNGGGFEDVGISADSQVAILAGNSTSAPPVFIRAPFGSTSATFNVPLAGVTNTARGNGAVRFLPPGLAPGLTISKSAAATVPSGSNLTYTINYGNTGQVAATNVVITDPLPAGTTFVSATGGGSLVGGNVVWNIGTVNAGASGSVSFTVTVNTAQDGTVNNNNYTIEADGVAPIPGPPVSTTVTAPVIVLSVSKSAAATVPSGSNLTYTINYGNTGSANAANVVITDPLPAGTTFVSATGGGSLVGGNVVWNIGTVNAGASGSVSFTVTVNLPEGGVVVNSGYTIQATGVNPVTGEAVTTQVLAPLFPPNVCVSRIRLNQSTTGFPPGPVTVQGITVNPNPSLDARAAVFTARRETTEIEFANYICRPTRLKICKIAGAGVAIGTPFTFDITIDSVGGLFNETVAPVTVQAGPAAQGGFCVFAQGPSQYPLIDTNPAIRSFRVGSIVTVTERPVAGTTLTGVTSPTGTPTVNLPGRSATLTLGFPGGFNELAFTNAAAPVGTLTQRAPFDFDGDNKSDASVYRNGTWTWTRSSNGGQQSVDFGLATDVTAPADFDGDNKTDVAVFRDGTWHILQSSNGQYKGIQFGQAGDIAQPGDFDGDGSADVAVFRPSTGAWYINRSRDGFFGMQFGIATDRAAAGDYDGDGATDIAVYRPADGAWYIMQSRDGFKAVQFGIASDRIVAADYDGDGRTDPAVYRNGAWYMLRSTAGFGYVQFGVAADRPVPGDYNGDGKADVGVYRDGTWHIMLSGASEATYTSMVLGGAADFPVPTSYVR